jgi:hypothetical protein
MILQVHGALASWELIMLSCMMGGEETRASKRLMAKVAQVCRLVFYVHVPHSLLMSTRLMPMVVLVPITLLFCFSLYTYIKY